MLALFINFPKLLFLRGEKFSCVILEGAVLVPSLTFHFIILLREFCVVIHVGCHFDVLLEFFFILLYLTRCFCVYLLIVRDLYFARIPDPCVVMMLGGYFCLRTFVLVLCYLHY